MCVLPLSQPNGQTNGLEFWYVGQVEGYLGQVRRSRSKVKVTGSKNVSMGISKECLLRNRLSNITTVRNTTMWGVFKAYAFFFKFFSQEPRK